MKLPASWKTTLAGIALIAGGITLIILQPEEKLETGIALIVTGAGLIAARDNGVTSEAAGAWSKEAQNLLDKRR